MCQCQNLSCKGECMERKKLVNNIIGNDYLLCKLGCVVRMIVDSLLPHAESEPNDYRKDGPPFIRISKIFRILST